MDAQRDGKNGKARRAIKRTGQVLVAFMLVHALTMAVGHDDEWSSTAVGPNSTAASVPLSGGAFFEHGLPSPRCFDILSIAPPLRAPAPGTASIPEALFNPGDFTLCPIASSSLPHRPPQTLRALLQVYRI